MALIIYQNIDFQKPELLTEEEYDNIKRYGLDVKSTLPNFLVFHRNNIIAMSLFLIIYLLNKTIQNDFTEVFWVIGLIIIMFGLPKISIDTYKYLKYWYNERSYKKRLIEIINNSSSYIHFAHEYNEEFNKSKFGKWLIKNFKR